MLREIVPANRWITVLLALGLLALIVYGALRHDPATIVIVAALIMFFALPAGLLFAIRRREREAMDGGQQATDDGERED